jgi:hypothetical protein
MLELCSTLQGFSCAYVPGAATSSLDDRRGSAAAVVGGKRLGLKGQTIPNLIGNSPILIGFGQKFRGLITDAGAPVTYRVSNLPVFTGRHRLFFRGNLPLKAMLCYLATRL